MHFVVFPLCHDDDNDDDDVVKSFEVSHKIVPQILNPGIAGKIYAIFL